EETLKELLTYAKNQQEEHFSNGRFIRNLLERAIRSQAVRLLEEGDYGKAELMTLKSTYLKKAYHHTDVKLE
ncbi:hypothetical protein, partial [Pseudomonas sp. 2995-1]|uniref:hypothetical protein n=1 Tax=Pseudomonas sp. 2995-1 TaxID=1712679 RepID=UPI001C457844